MASEKHSYSTVPEVVTGYPTPTSSDTRPPPPRTRRHPDECPECTDQECLVGFSAICCSLFTLFAFIYIFTEYLNNVRPQAKFTIQSIAVSSNSSSTWHVDFLVKNPISRYIIYYESDETSVRFGDLNAAVLSTSHEPKSSSHTAFSMDFVAEGNRDDVIFEELDIKLKASRKLYGVEYKNAGHIDIKCHNLTKSHDNIHKIQCQSSYIGMVTLDLNPQIHIFS